MHYTDEDDDGLEIRVWRLEEAMKEMKQEAAPYATVKEAGPEGKPQSYIRDCVFRRVVLSDIESAEGPQHFAAHMTKTEESDHLRMKGLFVTPVGEGVNIYDLPSWVRWLIRAFISKDNGYATTVRGGRK